ncbi:hypothetical protein NDU88_004782 [Pleurodeles waltl]|uniref:Uncharacterized protein n=1 Tax=Pleurodeles waltl TaxID=8319 RepID=A0AAV7VLQ6_PLEWA|nr:hypothetical protein NDU88_004782 [Pleurodeles waltl]
MAAQQAAPPWGILRAAVNRRETAGLPFLTAAKAPRSECPAGHRRPVGGAPADPRPGGQRPPGLESAPKAVIMNLAINTIDRRGDGEQKTAIGGEQKPAIYQNHQSTSLHQDLVGGNARPPTQPPPSTPTPRLPNNDAQITLAVSGSQTTIGGADRRRRQVDRTVRSAHIG